MKDSQIERIFASDEPGATRERWRVGDATVDFTTVGDRSTVTVYPRRGGVPRIPLLRIDMHRIATAAGILYDYVPAIGEPICEIAANDRERFLQALVADKPSL